MNCENAPTLEALKEIQEAREKDKKRIELALSLKICPCCGSYIISQPYEPYERPRTVFGIVTSKGKVWDRREVCRKDKSHYESKEDYPRNYDLY